MKLIEAIKNCQLLVDLKPVINYLDICKRAPIDWTTSLPISSPTQEIKHAGGLAFFNENLHSYTNAEIKEELLEAVVNYFNKKFIKCAKEHIKIRYSSFDVLADLYRSLNLDKDASLLIAAPTFGYQVYQAAQYNVNIQLIFAKKTDNWKLDPFSLDQALNNSKAKLFLFTNPVNPTGVFYTKKEVTALANVIKKHDVFTISDEIFSDIYFSERPYSIAAVKGMFERTLTLSGLGKSRGIRLSFSCDTLNFINQLPVSGILNPIQAAAFEALKLNDINKEYLASTIRLYKDAIRFIIHIVELQNSALQHYYNDDTVYIKPYILPESTNIFLIAFPGFLGKELGEKTIMCSLDLARYFYEKKGIAMVPGEGFFIDGREMVLRIPISHNRNELQQGFDAILQSLKNK